MRIEEANAELVRAFLDYQRDTRGRQPSSVYDYATRLNRLLLHVGKTPLGSVSLKQLESWVNRIRGGRAGGTIGAPASRAKDATVIRSLYGYLHSRDMIERNPAALLHAPAIHNVNPKPVPTDLWERVWTSTALPEDARVVLGLGYYVGLRRAEIVALSSSHFDTEGGRIVGFTRKGGGDDITPYGEMVGVVAEQLPQLIGAPETFLTPLHEAVAARMGRPRLLRWREQHVAPEGATLKHQLGSHDLDPEWVNQRFARWFRKVGIPDAAFTPHQLRHSCATNLLRAGVPVHIVSRLLNHSNLNVTMRYAKVGGDELAEWRKQKAAATPATSDVTVGYNRHG